MFKESRMMDGNHKGQKLGRISATRESAIQGTSIKTQSRSPRTIKPSLEMMEEKNATNDRDSFPCPSEGDNFKDSKITYASKGNLEVFHFP